MNKPHTSAKDFFLHLGAIVALYVVVISLLNLLFRVINVAFPQVASYYGASSSSISLPVAALIVFFPLLILLSWLTHKSYRQEPEKKQLGIRKWLTNITLFIAGLALAGDLVTLLYYFLDGQELTPGFLLKVLAVFVVATGIFIYYIQDLRERLRAKDHKIWTIGAGGLVLISIIIGFGVIGSPQSQRLARYDDQKVAHLQDIQWRVINYWQQKGTVPSSLEDLRDSLSNADLPRDPQTGDAYIYRQVSPNAFALCAEFNRATTDQKLSVARAPVGYGLENENWQHGVGGFCFDRTIDPELYKVIKPY